MTRFIRTPLISVSDSLARCEYLQGEETYASVRRRSLAKCLACVEVWPILVEMNGEGQRAGYPVRATPVKVDVVSERGMC